MKRLLEALKFNADEHVPAMIINEETNQPLTLCYLTREALEKTLETGRVHVFRRSQGRLMLKGETSGHIQEVRRVYVDCEGKSLVMYIRQHVAGCHMGYMSCYFRQYNPETDEFTVTEERIFNPDEVY